MSCILLHEYPASQCTFCCISVAALCETTLVLNLSSLVLLVSLLAACMPSEIPRIRVCSTVLPASVTFGRPYVEDLELRGEKNAGETQTYITVCMNEWLKKSYQLETSCFEQV